MDVKKKRKNHFPQIPKKKKKVTLNTGMKGFLCTCNFREKDCIFEALNILKEYAEKIDNNHLQHKHISVGAETFKTDINESIKIIHEDVLYALNSEINLLKAEKSKLTISMEFQEVNTGVSNIIFIKTNTYDPLELFTLIANDLYNNKRRKTRYLLRMIPIQIVCKPYLEDITSKADILFNKYFLQEPKSYSIVFNRHSNNNLNRNQVIEELARIIAAKNPGNKANLKCPNVSIIIEVVKANCLIAIAPNYFLFKKYNLLKLSDRSSEID